MNDTTFCVVAKDKRGCAVYVRYSALGRRQESNILTPAFLHDRETANAIVQEEKDAYVQHMAGVPLTFPKSDPADCPVCLATRMICTYHAHP